MKLLIKMSWCLSGVTVTTGSFQTGEQTIKTYNLFFLKKLLSFIDYKKITGIHTRPDAVL